MNLSTKLEGDQVRLMRGRVKIGSFKLDRDRQIIEVVVNATATPPEDELIIRLAASHAAQYVIDRQIPSFGGLFIDRRLSPIPGLRPERSAELLDFNAIAPQHAKLTVEELESVLRSMGVKILRHAS